MQIYTVLFQDGDAHFSRDPYTILQKHNFHYCSNNWGFLTVVLHEKIVQVHYLGECLNL